MPLSSLSPSPLSRWRRRCQAIVIMPSTERSLLSSLSRDGRRVIVIMGILSSFWRHRHIRRFRAIVITPPSAPFSCLSSSSCRFRDFFFVIVLFRQTSSSYSLSSSSFLSSRHRHFRHPLVVFTVVQPLSSSSYLYSRINVRCTLSMWTTGRVRSPEFY